MPRGLGGIICGPEGVGKTSFCMQAKDPTVLCIHQTGAPDLNDTYEWDCPYEEIDTYRELISYINKVQGTLIIDDVRGLQAIMREYSIEVDYDNNASDFDKYWNGMRQSLPPIMSKFCALLSATRKKGTNVLICANTVNQLISNPQGKDYVKCVIDMDEGDTGKGVRPILTQWAQFILYFSPLTAVSKTGKATGAGKRVMFTSTDPTHMAKNRLNLPATINMGSTPQEAFTNFKSKLPKAYQDV